MYLSGHVYKCVYVSVLFECVCVYMCVCCSRTRYCVISSNNEIQVAKLFLSVIANSSCEPLLNLEQLEALA